ncbi:uncharacterized protein LOC126284316 isoform X1 [Schistocerca gregaria]|uniref:uncharacterized protein LOC126284316 isoform X1 n=1 Tax=Schistocerca gregaria TaxID=7010 RepID=UPI00211DCC6D|nr:uncharacterized protein LOC126284316 isoform X1 [Schistocerca gregaria]
MFKLAALALLVVAAASAVPVTVEEHSSQMDPGTGAAVTSTVTQQRSGGNFAYTVHESRQIPGPLVPAPVLPAVQAPVLPVPLQLPGLQYALPQAIVPGAAAPAVIAAPYGHLPVQKV